MFWANIAVWDPPSDGYDCNCTPDQRLPWGIPIALVLLETKTVAVRCLPRHSVDRDAVDIDVDIDWQGAVVGALDTIAAGGGRCIHSVVGVGVGDCPMWRSHD